MGIGTDMNSIIITYQGRDVKIDLPEIDGTVELDDLAGLVARKLTLNFSSYMKKKGVVLTTKSKERYYISQYVLMKFKIMEQIK